MNTTALASQPAGASIRLNIGCGPIQPNGWVNIDNANRAKLASKLPWLDRLLVRLRLLPPTEHTRRTCTADIKKSLPFAANSVDAIYSGEMLEHFTANEGAHFLAECFRMLKPGGVLRIRVPDNFRFWQNYVSQYERTFSLPRESWNTEHERWVAMFFRDICVRRPGLKSMGHYHKWMYDEITLTRAFERAGFVEVARRSFCDSRISDVAVVESHEDLTIEGIKPTL